MKRPPAPRVFSTSRDNAIAGQGWEADMAETRIGVIGCAGRVGRMLIADIVAAEGCALAGGVARPGSTAVGQDLGEPAGTGRNRIAGGASPAQPVPHSHAASH